MSWLIAAAALCLVGLVAVHRPHVRSALAELTVVVAVSTAVGYMLFKPDSPRDIATLLSQRPACAAAADRTAEPSAQTATQAPAADGC